MLSRIFAVVVASLVAGCSQEPCAPACAKINADCPDAKDGPGALCETLCHGSQKRAADAGCGDQYDAVLDCIASADDKTTCSGDFLPPSCATLGSESKACAAKAAP